MFILHTIFLSLQLDQDMYDILEKLEETDTTRLVSNEPYLNSLRYLETACFIFFLHKRLSFGRDPWN